MDDLLSEFITETNESLETVDTQLVHLERNPNDKAILDNIFRLVHTVKGTCGFLTLPRLESVAHAAENVLGKFRDGALVVTPPAVTLILASLDRIKAIVLNLSQTGLEPDGDDKVLIEQLDAAAAGALSPPRAVETPPPVAVVQAAERSLKLGEVSLEELEAVFAATPGPQGKGDVEPVVSADVAAAVIEAAKGNQSIRVSVDLLEDLMNLVSELVLTRNQLLQIVRRHDNSEFSLPLQRLSQCTSELQEGVMKTRMQPIGNAWAKLPRIVRDLSMELGKKIELDMRGQETELDRQVLELIKDPLTHMVRNSADHGVESAADRLAAGKPEAGTIRLNAFHEGGYIIIQVADDGRGIDCVRLKAKLLQTGVATEAELAAMSDAQIQKYIFNAGLSTAEKVTAVSGRGVGMDVVKSNIEKIGGTIELESRLGKGTKFSIKIPLTLAIVSALIVEAGHERFAIPQISVLELVRAVAVGDNRIEFINDYPVFRLRNRLLPLVYLHNVLGLERADYGDRDSFIVVTQVGGFTFGIVVDGVFDTEEIVVKPVSPILKNLPFYSGNTILGDGSVIMILDPNGVASSLASLQESEREEAQTPRLSVLPSERESMLVFRAGPGAPKAAPLALVARLEEIAPDRIEWSEGQPVVQYRGQLMPLVTIDPDVVLKTDVSQPVLVFADGDKVLGLAVDAILDIVAEDLVVEMSAHKNGRVGTAIIHGKVTEILDVSHYLRLGFPENRQPMVKKNAYGGKVGSKKRDVRVLLVDDSAFFRNLLRPILMASGYVVTTVPDAQAALQLREEGADFDLIISDIEMPGLDGFGFCQAVRAEGAWRAKPVVALSSLSGQADLERGRLAGFSDYVSKFDRENLLQILQEQLDQSTAA